jgi:hypothetical protein
MAHAARLFHVEADGFVFNATNLKETFQGHPSKGLPPGLPLWERGIFNSRKI